MTTTWETNWEKIKEIHRERDENIRNKAKEKLNGWSKEALIERVIRDMTSEELFEFVK